MRSFRIGSAFGIPIKLDLTFLLVLPLFAYLIGSQSAQIVELLNEILGANIGDGIFVDGAVRWILGTVAALGLFVGVLLHELGHSLVARRYGFPIDSITLWIFGGVASFTEMPEDWRQEFAIAIAGPVVSVLVGVVCYGLFVAVPPDVGGARFVLGYLAVLNVVLAVFNLLPAFPMDGGRILRAILGRTRPYARATAIAAEVGKFFAVILGLVGLFSFNILMIGIAFFVYIAASSESQQVQMKAAFEGVTVRDVMTPADRLHTVAPETTIAELLSRMFSERHTGYPVLEDGRPVGMVTLDDARDVQPVEREAYTVADVMTRELVTIPAAADAMEAFDLLQEHDVGRLLVVDARGDVVGLLSRTDLMTALDVVRSTDGMDPNDAGSLAD